MELHAEAIVDDSIHIGEYLKTFVARHRHWFGTLPTGLYTVCLGVPGQRA